MAFSGVRKLLSNEVGVLIPHLLGFVAFNFIASVCKQRLLFLGFNQTILIINGGTLALFITLGVQGGIDGVADVVNLLCGFSFFYALAMVIAAWRLSAQGSLQQQY